MYRIRDVSVFLALLMLMFIVGCNLPSAQPRSGGNALATQQSMATSVALTAQAILQSTLAAGGAAMPSNTPAPAQPTSPPTATWTPSPTPLPCNWAQFIADVTYPDGTEVETGEHFTKTWRLKNIGSCAWTTGYELIFDHGDRMGAPAAVNLPRTVAPGETVDISVELTAPDTEGTYKGYFRLRSDTGEVFGIGGDRLGAFWVEIKAKEPRIEVQVEVWGDTGPYTGSCPHRFEFYGRITVNRATTVQYRWLRSDGARAPVKTITFTGPGSQVVSSIWQLGAEGNFWKQLEIISPVPLLSDKLSFSVDCSP